LNATAELQLTDYEKTLLDGAAGPTAARAMELLSALARIHGAREMVEIDSVQVSGVSYHNLGDAGLAFVEDWASNGKVQVALATLNPAGMDLRRWKTQHIPAEFAQKQLRLIAAYTRMGIVPSCTCTPYLSANLPRFGQHIAWAESSAVTFANAVLGARTNREGGPAALAAALVGRTPRWGLHESAARAATVEVHVSCPLQTATDWGVLGAWIGTHQSGALPLITRAHETPVDISRLKALAAALPTFGAQPMFHLAGVTPEAERHPLPETRVTFGAREHHQTLAQLNDPVEEIDLVCLGCPHATLEELVEVAEMLSGRTTKRPLWLCTSRAVAALATQSGLSARLEQSGARIYCDTCFVVAPLKGIFRSVATDSAKGCYYARGHNRMQVRTTTRRGCIEGALSGRIPLA
jgi:hypothetical protein